MIIGLGGYAQTGKDTVADYLVKHHNFTRVAYADRIREALFELDPIVTIASGSPVTLKPVIDLYGWDEAKILFPEVRRLIQRFGTEVGRTIWDENFWVKQAFSKIKQYENVVVTDVRFVNEAVAIQANGGKLWRVVRNNVGPVNRHSSEVALDNFDFDATIDNNGSLKSLHAIVDSLL
jgi:hypothetical protein